MCGICGEIRFDGAQPSVSAVEAMTGAMVSRGPDSGGLFCQRNVALGQRRLKIIDVSERAQQPMVDSELGLVIVYNGAVYNYPELRAQLESKGYRFFSSGDTEVVLKAYHAWGARCVERLNGMFAFAIWERDSGRVFLARDRLGIKPLYLARLPDGLRFASSLPALLAAGDVSSEIDPVALHHYMTFHSVVPSPRTILRSIEKLPPATTKILEPDGASREDTYWRLTFEEANDSHCSFEEWRHGLHDQLKRAVERRLLADVPVGVLLSGGLDSSLVVGLLAEAGQDGLHTFSIGFEGVGGEAGNEFEYSDLIAKCFGTRHQKIEVDSAKVLPSLDRCVRAMSEPMVSHDCIGFYLLSEAVSRHVKVVESGQGADEVFAGYHWYPPLLRSREAVRDYASVFFDRDHHEYARAVHPRFVNGNSSLDFVAQHFQQAPAQRAIDRALHLDTTVMLVEDPVKRVDNMTMAWGLEARVPFLDHELVELAARMPAELKVKKGGKHILKEVARSVIPSQVIDRPKGYFPVPALKYLRGEYLARVRDVLEQPAARQRGLFNREYVAELLSDPESHITPLNGSKLWGVVLLEYWLQAHNI